MHVEYHSMQHALHLLSTCCSIVINRWKNQRNEPLQIRIISCSERTYFLRSIHYTLKKKNDKIQSKVLCEVIEGIRTYSVVQVIINVTLVCKAAGFLIHGNYKYIYWTTCCVCAMNNVLKKIGRLDLDALYISQDPNIPMFICNYHKYQAIYQLYTKVDLLKPTKFKHTFYNSCYSTLEVV